jgi:prophage maintenance system killer protein
MATTSAVDMAKQAGIDPKRFRKALRDEHFSWHNHNDRWTVGRQHTGLGDTLKYPRPIESAATLAYGVCCDHAFHNGNKRAALVAMLVHLDRNKLSLFDVGQKELFDMIIAVASHSFDYKRKRKSNGRPNPDDEVKAIAQWLSDSADRVVRGEKPITYRQLRKILEGFDYGLGDTNGNYIDVVKYEVREKGFFRRERVRVKKHITSIAYPGETKEVAMRVIKDVRRICKLREEDGVDSSSFYDQTVVMDAFINRYRKILTRLANR